MLFPATVPQAASLASQRCHLGAIVACSDGFVFLRWRRGQSWRRDTCWHLLSDRYWRVQFRIKYVDPQCEPDLSRSVATDRSKFRTGTRSCARFKALPGFASLTALQRTCPSLFEVSFCSRFGPIQLWGRAAAAQSRPSCRLHRSPDDPAFCTTAPA